MPKKTKKKNPEGLTKKEERLGWITRGHEPQTPIKAWNNWFDEHIIVDGFGRGKANKKAKYQFLSLLMGGGGMASGGLVLGSPISSPPCRGSIRPRVSCR